MRRLEAHGYLLLEETTNGWLAMLRRNSYPYELLEGSAHGLDKDKPVFVYCASGNRAGKVSEYLNKHGYRVVNIGGLSDWMKAGGTTS